MPARASVSPPASASAISSSPVDGSTWCACIDGRLGGGCSAGGACTISTRISWAVTASRRFWIIASNSVKASDLYSLSGSRWP